MKRSIKSYLVFTSRLYRWLLFVLLPAAAMGLQAAAAAAVRNTTGAHMDTMEAAEFSDRVMYAIMFGAALLMPLIEILVDGLAFGGVATKGGVGSAYLKSSSKGLRLVRTALRTDLVRTFLESITVPVLEGAVWAVPGLGPGKIFDWKDLALILAIALGEYCVTAASLLAVRYFDSVQVYAAVISISYLALMLLLGLCILNRYFMLAVLAAAALGISVIGQRGTMRRMEESYYDQRP